LRFPQDVERSWKSGRLFILQCRPITTTADVFYSRYLEPWKDNPKADPVAKDRVWSRMMADETWVSPISPLFYDIHNLTAAHANHVRRHATATRKSISAIALTSSSMRWMAARILPKAMVAASMGRTSTSVSGSADNSTATSSYSGGGAIRRLFF